jgi:hypothetical protein
MNPARTPVPGISEDYVLEIGSAEPDGPAPTRERLGEVAEALGVVRLGPPPPAA